METACGRQWNEIISISCFEVQIASYTNHFIYALSEVNDDDYKNFVGISETLLTNRYSRLDEEFIYILLDQNMIMTKSVINGK